MNPSFASSAWGVAQCLDTQGRRDEARAQYRRYLELAPKGPHADKAKKRLS